MSVMHTLRWLGLAPGTQLADLMGTKGQRKGGMKSSHMHKVGPVLQLNGVHSDQRPLTVSLQVIHCGRSLSTSLCQQLFAGVMQHLHNVVMTTSASLLVLSRLC